MPADQLKALLADPEALKQVLLYHVVAGAVMSTDLADGMEAATVQGAPVKFMLGADGAAMVNDANIVTADIPASNGVIHVIDKVHSAACWQLTPYSSVRQAAADRWQPVGIRHRCMQDKSSIGRPPGAAGGSS